MYNVIINPRHLHIVKFTLLIAIFINARVTGDNDRLCLPNTISGQYTGNHREYYVAISKNIKLRYSGFRVKLTNAIKQVKEMKDEVKEVISKLLAISDASIVKDDVGRNIKIVKINGTRTNTPLRCAVAGHDAKTRGWLPGVSNVEEFYFWEKMLKEFGMSETFTDIVPRKSPPGYYSRGRFVQAFGGRLTYADVKDKGAVLLKVINENQSEVGVIDTDQVTLNSSEQLLSK